MLHLVLKLIVLDYFLIVKFLSFIYDIIFMDDFLIYEYITSWIKRLKSYY